MVDSPVTESARHIIKERFPPRLDIDWDPNLNAASQTALCPPKNKNKNKKIKIPGTKSLLLRTCAVRPSANGNDIIQIDPSHSAGIEIQLYLR